MHAMLSCEPRLTTTKRSPIFNAPPRQLCVRTTSSSTRQLRDEAKGEERQEEQGEEGNRVIGEKETGKNNEWFANVLDLGTGLNRRLLSFCHCFPFPYYPVALFPLSPYSLFPFSPLPLLNSLPLEDLRDHHHFQRRGEYSRSLRVGGMG